MVCLVSTCMVEIQLLLWLKHVENPATVAKFFKCVERKKKSFFLYIGLVAQLHSDKCFENMCS